MIASALKLLTNAKKHATTRLLVQFDSHSAYTDLGERKAEIDREIRRHQQYVDNFDQREARREF